MRARKRRESQTDEITCPSLNRTLMVEPRIMDFLPGQYSTLWTLLLLKIFSLEVKTMAMLDHSTSLSRLKFCL